MNRRLVSIGAVLKKDLLTLLPLTLVAVALPLLKPWYGEFALLSRLASPGIIAGVVSALLAFIVVQNDAPVSTSHDWLTRPIRRDDMAIAKGIYLFLTIYLPWEIGHLASLIIVEHLPLGEVLLAASGQLIFAALLLPLLALACVTGNKVQAVIALVCVVAVIAIYGMIETRIGGATAIIGSGFGWPGEWLALAAVTAACLVVLWLQYVRRRTLAARGAILAGVIFIGAAGMVPSGSAGSVSDAAQATSTLALAAPTVCRVDKPYKTGPFGMRTPGNPQTYPGQWRASEIRQAGSEPVAIVVSNTVTGLPAGWIVAIDRLETRYGEGSAALHPRGGGIRTRSSEPAAISSRWLLSKAEAAAVAKPDADLRLDAHMTLLKPAKTYRFPADGKRHRIPGLGYCGTKNGGPTMSSMVDCLNVWPVPAMLTARFASQPQACTINCGEPVYAPAWAQIPTARRFKPQIMGGAPGEDVVITVYEPAGRVHRTADVRGPAPQCQALASLGSPAVAMYTAGPVTITTTVTKDERTAPGAPPPARAGRP